MSVFSRKREFLFVIFLFTTVIISLVIITANNNQKTYRSKAQETISPTPVASPSAQIALLETEVVSNNGETNRLLDQYEQTTDEGEKQTIISNIENNLIQRKKNQISLLELSPISVYQKAFDQGIINKLQTVGNIKKNKLVEERIDRLQGIVNTTIYDDFENNRSYTDASFIPDDNQEEEINFYPADGQTFLSGTKAVLHNAIKIDKDQEVLGIASSVYAQDQEQQQQYIATVAPTHLIAVDITLIKTPPLDTLGEQKILVLLACLDDLDCAQLPAPQEIEQRINNEINEFFKRDSYNNMSLVAHTTSKWLKVKKEILINEQSKPWDETIGSWKLEKKILSEFARDIEFKEYERLAIILVKDDQGNGGESALGKRYKIKIADQTINSSILTVFAPLKSSYFFDSLYNTVDGNMSKFDKVFSHEFIHSLGGHHAGLTKTLGNTFISIDGLKDTALEEYGNSFEIMGTHTFGFYSNAYIKKEFAWIGQNKEANILKIDRDKPEGEYTLKKMGSQGQIAAWLPYSSLYKETNKDFFHVDQFLEYRKNPIENGLVINLLEKPKSYSNALMKTILFPATGLNGFLSSSYKENDIFFDQAHGIKIKVKDIKEDEDELTFIINRCQKEKPPDASLFYLIPNRAGNGKIVSINVFESDLITFKSPSTIQYFSIENVVDCEISLYFIPSSMLRMQQENTYITLLVFKEKGESIPIYPYKTKESSFSVFSRLNDPKLPNTTITFSVNKDDHPSAKKTLTYELNLVPSPDEYKNDLEPYMIDIKDKDINNKDFNHLEAKKQQILLFTSNIANNSRNPDGNKSSDFFVKWEIQDEKGNNVIPPFRQRHDGITPKSIDNAHPATLTWTIPQDLPVGDYKVILEVDSNNRLQEFNENNNIIWRYFNVVD